MTGVRHADVPSPDLLTRARYNGADAHVVELADADIPSSIARDSEVSAAIAALSDVYQPLDADLTAVAGTSTTSFGRGLLALADQAALQAAVGSVGGGGAPPGWVDVTAYGADPTGDDDSTAAILDAQEDGSPWFPPGLYRITDWLPMRSHRHWRGAGASSVIWNDLSNGDTQRHACILPGNMHPGYYAHLAGYALDAIAQGARSVTCTTAGDAANLSVGELVIVADTTTASNVPRHAQLNKVVGISSGTLTLEDQMVEAIASGKVWKVQGGVADPSASGTDIYAVEDVSVAGLTLRGRNPIATKGAAFHATFGDLRLEGWNFLATNMMTHALFDRLSGTWTNRYLELACNSYDVVCRDLDGEWDPNGATQTTFPIHIGEQPWGVTLERVRCRSAFETAGDWAQVKGRHVTIVDPDWVNESTTSGSTGAMNVPDSPFTGWGYDDIRVVRGRLKADRTRVAIVGSNTTIAGTNPTRVRFVDGVRLEGSPDTNAILWNNGSGHQCSVDNQTGKQVTVTVGCQFPDMSGYRGWTQP